MKLFQPITIDLNEPCRLKRVVMQQNNVGRGVDVTLTAGGSVVDPSGEDVKMWAKRPDGSISYLPCTVQEDGIIRVPFSNQMIAVPGKVIVSLELINGEDDITTPIFYVNNEVNIADHDAAESSNEFTAFQLAIAEMNELMKNHSLTEKDMTEIYEELYP